MENRTNPLENFLTLRQDVSRGELETDFFCFCFLLTTAIDPDCFCFVRMCFDYFVCVFVTWNV